MERDSNKHSPRIDEEMKREVDALTHGKPVESRIEEFRQAEPLNTTPNPTAVDEGTGSLRPDEVELRQDLARFLDRLFPATKTEILSNAQDNGAPDHVLAWFKRLPERSYDGFPQVWEVGSGHHEPRVI